MSASVTTGAVLITVKAGVSLYCTAYLSGYIKVTNGLVVVWFNVNLTVILTFGLTARMVVVSLPIELPIKDETVTMLPTVKPLVSGIVRRILGTKAVEATGSLV